MKRFHPLSENSFSHRLSAFSGNSEVRERIRYQTSAHSHYLQLDANWNCGRQSGRLDFYEHEYTLLGNKLFQNAILLALWQREFPSNRRRRRMETEKPRVLGINRILRIPAGHVIRNNAMFRPEIRGWCFKATVSSCGAHTDYAELALIANVIVRSCFLPYQRQWFRIVQERQLLKRSAWEGVLR